MSSVPVSVADAAASATISGTRTHRIVLFGATELLGMVLAGRPAMVAAVGDAVASVLAVLVVASGGAASEVFVVQMATMN